MANWWLGRIKYSPSDDLRGSKSIFPPSAAIELVEDRDERRFFDPEKKVGQRFAQACLNEGIIVRPLPDGDMIAFAPPLIVTQEDLDEIIERTRRAFDKLCKEL